MSSPSGVNTRFSASTTITFAALKCPACTASSTGARSIPFCGLNTSPSCTIHFSLFVSESPFLGKHAFGKDGLGIPRKSYADLPLGKVSAT